MNKAVIGGGPAGCFYASQVSDVHIFEEHKEIGNPIACTGIITDSIHSVVKVKKSTLVSHISSFKITSPDGKSISIPLKKKNPIFDRKLFDQHMLELAIDNGAKVHTGEKFLGYKKTSEGITFKTTKGSYSTSMLVGADGVASPVARSMGVHTGKYVRGWQARCKMPDLEEGVTEIRLNVGEFVWIVPEDDKIARVGIIGKDDVILRKNFEKLLGGKVIEDQSGLIPIYNPKQVLGKDNVYLLGDAATQVKATTYGGILYGLIAGKLLASNPSTYQNEFRKGIGKDLMLSLRIRKMMNAMTDEQANRLIEIFQKEKNIKILSEHDRDFPTKFIIPLLLKEPRLWFLGLGILKNRVF